MPGWHDATKQLQQQGKVQMVGIVQEQHPDRARLFMQWKEMGWPLMVDSLDLLGVGVVPITLAIDEHGIVRMAGLRRSGAASIEADFLAKEFDEPEDLAQRKTEMSDVSKLKSAAIRSGSAEAWLRYAQALTLWGGERRLDEAVQAFESSLAVEPDHAPTHFGRGVALRARYDSPGGRPEDFQAAVDAWGRALMIDPNNYIWRRRIQQYGPRLGKPYPFYDWVENARREIRARGDDPVDLVVEPGGAEFAQPLRSFEAAEAAEEPDPDERIRKDPGKLIRVETTVVPRAVPAGGTARVHVSFRPNGATGAHWNNEARDLRFWVSLPEGWEVDRQTQTVPRPREVVSLETRKVEFEVHAPAEAGAGDLTLRAYALYYVCEDVKGACLYRRQDVPVRISIRD